MLISFLNYSLLILTAILPLYIIRFKIFNLPSTVLEVSLLVFFISLLLIVFLKKINIWPRFKNDFLENKIFYGLIFLILFISFCSIFYSQSSKFLALGHWRAYFLEPILLFLIIFIFRSKINLNFIFIGLGISAFYLSSYALWQKIAGQGILSLEEWQWPLIPIKRVNSIFPHPNFLGLYLGPLTALFFYLGLGRIFKNQKKLSLVFIFLFFLSFLAIIFAKSEGAILAVVISLFISFFFLKINIFSSKIILWEDKFKIFFLIIIFLILFFSLPLFRSYIFEKITFSDISGITRLQIWRETFLMLKDNFLFGAGLRGYQKAIQQYHQPIKFGTDIIPFEIHPYPHNLYLAFWSELGFFGFLIFIIFIFYLLIKIIKKLKIEKLNSEKNKLLIIGSFSSFLTVLIHGLVDTPYFKNDLSILFWLIIFLLTKNNNDI